MGLEPLKQKLLAELTSTEKLTEPRVVYMLVCVRKLMEIEHSGLKSLKFHCDWALHSRMEKGGAIEVLKRFDDLENALRNGDSARSERARRKLQGIVAHSNFRREMGDFLSGQGLPDDLSILTERWRPFWNLYLEIVSDVPLEFTTTRIRDVRRVILRRVDDPFVPRELSPGFAFGVRWEAERFDGEAPMDHGLNYDVSQ